MRGAAMQAIRLTSPSPVLPTTNLRRRCLRITAQSQASRQTLKLNKYSSRIKEPKSRGRGASQAMLHGDGFSVDDLSKPRVGILSVWDAGNTCNLHLLKLSEELKWSVEESGMVGVSNEMYMGMGGVGKEFESSDLIADRNETVMSAHCYDGNISIPGRDENIPATIIAMGRLNRPSIMVCGGTIKCDGEYVSGKISDEQRKNVILNSCPGAGACGGMYTANTMASAIEAMGMSLPYSSSIPAEDPLKLDECRLAGKYLLELLKMDLKPRDINTRKSLHNAMVVVMALGGSTNAVLHLIAIARSVGLELTMDDFQRVSDNVPFLADLKLSGKYVMEDVHKIGGTPVVIRYLMEFGYLDGDCMTVTGKTIAENAQSYPRLPDGLEIIKPISNPIKETGRIQILGGNLAPEGSVAKITGKEGLYFSDPALVFEGEEATLADLSENPSSFKPGNFHGNAYDIVSAFRVNFTRAFQLVGAFVSKVLSFQLVWKSYVADVTATVIGVLTKTLMDKVMAKLPLVLRLFFGELARRLTVDFVKYISKILGELARRWTSFEQSLKR